MLKPEHKRLVEAYIASRTWVLQDDMVLRQKDDSDWAEAALYDLAWEQPALAWEVMREIARATESDEILQELANGPLHQLLAEHASTLSDIESDAKAEAAVRRLLAAMWEEQPLPEGIKARVTRAAQGEH